MTDTPKRVVFASRERLIAVEHLAPRFFEEVMGYDYGDCLITDESALRDFTSLDDDPEGEVAATLDLIEAHHAENDVHAGAP